MSELLRLRLRPHIQPFEKVLAEREAGAVLCSEVRWNGDEWAEADGDGDKAAQALTYWLAVSSGERPPTATVQAQREYSGAVSRDEVPVDSLLTEKHALSDISFSRRELRYGPHGLHEYKGKYFPQLVRALLTLCNLPKGSTVLDPFCGSGTTLVEANLLGHDALGYDLNPLSVFISQVKTLSLSMSPHGLTTAQQRVEAEIRRHAIVPQSSVAEYWEDDYEYLDGWFPTDVLEEILRIIAVIDTVCEEPFRSFFTLALSDVLRANSLQDETDLRVRRAQDKRPTPDGLQADFLEKAAANVRSVAAMNSLQSPFPMGSTTVKVVDTRCLARETDRHGQVDAILTSPPYATALPYIDTDRLSLSVLRLLPRGLHREREKTLIGGREIGTLRRRELETALTSNAAQLPVGVADFVRGLAERQERHPEIGFRKRNVPALLYRYFHSMKIAFEQTAEVLKHGGNYFVVIGTNSTRLNGERITIPTDDLLAELGESLGLELIEKLPMTMLPSRGVHRENAVRSESILRFVKPQ